MYKCFAPPTFVPPVGGTVSLGTLTISKITVGDTVAGQVFTFNIEPAINGISSVNLTAISQSAPVFVTISDVPFGTYTITEVVPPGWTVTPPNPIEVTILNSSPVTATFTNTLAPGTLEVTKTIVGTPVPGLFNFNFAVSPIAGATASFIIPIDVTAGATTGSIVIPNVIPGTYLITETQLPGFTGSITGSIFVPTQATGTVNFTNTVIPTGLNVTKIIDGTVAPGVYDFTFGVAPPLGTSGTFTISVDTTTGGTSGSILFTDIDAGAYVITETAVPGFTGTLINPVTVIASQTGQLDITNTVEGGGGVNNLLINKTIAGTPTPGVYTFDFSVIPSIGATSTFEITIDTTAGATTGSYLFTEANPLPFIITETPAVGFTGTLTQAITLVAGVTGIANFVNTPVVVAANINNLSLNDVETLGSDTSSNNLVDTSVNTNSTDNNLVDTSLSVNTTDSNLVNASVSVNTDSKLLSIDNNLVDTNSTNTNLIDTSVSVNTDSNVPIDASVSVNTDSSIPIDGNSSPIRGIISEVIPSTTDTQTQTHIGGEILRFP